MAQPVISPQLLLLLTLLRSILGLVQLVSQGSRAPESCPHLRFGRLAEGALGRPRQDEQDRRCHAEGNGICEAERAHQPSRQSRGETTCRHPAYLANLGYIRPAYPFSELLEKDEGECPQQSDSAMERG